jgi:hypothetical protein
MYLHWSCYHYPCISLYVYRLQINWEIKKKHIPAVCCSRAHAAAQAVSRRLPTAAARLRARSHVMWDLRWTKCQRSKFSLSIIPPTAPHSLSSGAGIIGQTVADVPSGLSPTPSQKLKEKLVSGDSKCLRLQVSECMLLALHYVASI